MGKSIERLSAIGVQRLKKPGMYPDGANLYLQIADGGSKAWIFRFKSPTHGRERYLGLGSINTFTLAEARQRAKEARQFIADGLDPIDAKNGRTVERATAAAKATTFAAECEAYIESERAGWKNAKHAEQWTNTLSTYCNPTMGSVDVARGDTALVAACLRPIWTTKTETATRLRGRIEKVLDFARVQGHREGENPARWRGHLEAILPAPGKVAKVVHHAALPYATAGAFLARLRAMPGMGARALEFAILTAARSGEVRGATWQEIDLAARVWIVPAERMKMQREHRVPLSDAALELLRALRANRAGAFVFPAVRGGQLSDMTLSACLRRMKVDAVPHGFRSTFRDWCAEQTSFPSEVAEMALAHAVGDKVEAAYRRGDLFEKRVALMKAWAQFLASVATPATVTPIKQRKT